MTKVQKYFYIIAVTILLVVFGVLMYALIRRSSSSPEAQNASIPKNNPPIRYDDAATQRLISSLKQRKPLNENDKQTKQRLVENATNKFSGGDYIVHQERDYIIFYLPSADLFLTEIKNIDIAETKKAAAQWLREQGLSNEGICKLPLSFYLNAQTAQQLKNLKTTFSPLPEDC